MMAVLAFPKEVAKRDRGKDEEGKGVLWEAI